MMFGAHGDVNENSKELVALRRLRRMWWGLLISGLCLLWWTEFSALGTWFEFWVSTQFYVPGVGFPLKYSPGFEFWWHKFPKYVVYALPIWAVLNVLYAIWRRSRLSVRQREQLRRWIVLLVLGVLSSVLLSLLKKWTNQACPWSLTEFGGVLPYVHLFEARPWPPGSQACWPAGHASVGLSLLVVSFVGGLPRTLWSNQMRWSESRFVLLSGFAFAIYAVLISMALGFSQVMKGAHFISHQFWSLWFVLVFLCFFTQVGVISLRWWFED